MLACGHAPTDLLLLPLPLPLPLRCAGSREGGQLAGKVQGRRTTGGQGPGKTDNQRAGSREGGQLAGRVQGWTPWQCIKLP